MFSLIYTDDGHPARHRVQLGETVIGRTASCDVVLNDPSVSRWHARLQTTDTRCVLIDAGSRNGTYRNGEPVAETEIADGDTLLLGEVPVQVEFSLEERLSLSEHHVMLDPGATVYRNIDDTGPLPSPVDAQRLLTLISEIGQTLVKTLPLSDVLDRVIDLTFDNLAAERAFLMLGDGTDAPPVPRVVRCRDRSVPDRATISSTLVRRVMTERVAMLASDARVDPRLDTVNSIQIQNIRSLMCAPLWNRNDVIGILYIDNPRSRQFTEVDLSLFTSLANYAAVAIDQARLFARVLEETRRRERLQRYHSPAVVDRILESSTEIDMPLTAQERDVTVMFADIVGFSTLAEGLPPPQVALLLNNFFSRMADVIFEHGGTLDKFIGDAVMAVFGAPFDQSDHALRGVEAALGMRRALAALNRERRDAPLEMRVALHSGVAMAGDIGSPKRREYTVLGDVVNIASRLESTVAQTGQIVISRATYDRVAGSVSARSLGSVSLRGRTQEIEAFEVTE